MINPSLTLNSRRDILLKRQERTLREITALAEHRDYIEKITPTFLDPFYILPGLTSTPSLYGGPNYNEETNWLTDEVESTTFSYEITYKNADMVIIRSYIRYLAQQGIYGSTTKSNRVTTFTYSAGPIPILVTFLRDDCIPEKVTTTYTTTQYTCPFEGKEEE